MKKYLFALPLTALLLHGCTSAPEKPNSGMALPPCGPLPNCVNSEDEEGGKTIEPIPASAEQWLALKTWLAAQEDWEITHVEDNFVQAVAKTPVMRFRDDVQLRFDESGGVIQVRSSSRLGIGDMGANRARIEFLRRKVAAADPAQ